MTITQVRYYRNGSGHINKVTRKVIHDSGQPRYKGKSIPQKIDAVMAFFNDFENNVDRGLSRICDFTV